MFLAGSFSRKETCFLSPEQPTRRSVRVHACGHARAEHNSRWCSGRAHWCPTDSLENLSDATQMVFCTGRVDLGPPDHPAPGSYLMYHGAISSCIICTPLISTSDWVIGFSSWLCEKPGGQLYTLDATMGRHHNIN